MNDRRSPAPVAYLTGEYPKVSHTFIQREIEALRRRGVHVQTFSIRRPGAKDILADQKAEEKQTYYVIEHCKQLAGFAASHVLSFFSSPVTYLTTLSLSWSIRQPGLKAAFYQLFYFAEAVVLARELSRRGVVHLHNHFADSSCTVAMLASALSKIPYSLTEHGPAIFFEAKRWHLEEKIARAKFVVAISHFCRSQLMLFSDSQHWKKITIVHCGLEPARYAAGDGAPPGKHLLYVGRLEPVKGLPILLEALAVLIRQHPDLQLTVVGDGTFRAATEAEAQRLGLTSNTKFIGYRTQNEVSALLANADMLVLPSFAEGVPVVLMEAMASGKPVIASRVAGVQELVIDGVNGFTVPPGDPASLATRIEQLIADPELRNRMGIAGRQMVEQHFNVDREASALARLFAGEAVLAAAEESRQAREPSTVTVA